MREVSAEAKTGYLVVLDQCPRCGGIWCDRWELYPITAAAARRLDGVDQAALHEAGGPIVPGPLLCPRCRAPMHKFHDPGVPEDARIERCPNCDGMWLNRGELRRFKSRDGAGAAMPAAASDAEIDRLAQRARGGVESWPTVSTLDRAFDATEATSETQDLRGEMVSGAAWLIARAALRLLLHV
jgi:Zn-finger nucleic acid-binding protein